MAMCKCEWLRMRSIFLAFISTDFACFQANFAPTILYNNVDSAATKWTKSGWERLGVNYATMNMFGKYSTVVECGSASCRFNRKYPKGCTKISLSESQVYKRLLCRRKGRDFIKFIGSLYCHTSAPLP